MEFSCIKEKTYVSNSIELKNTVLREMHNVPYVGNPRYHKSITVVKIKYFCLGMKKEVAKYIARCLEFQKVKIDH
jgi:hypothetical protein